MRIFVKNPKHIFNIEYWKFIPVLVKREVGPRWDYITGIYG